MALCLDSEKWLVCGHHWLYFKSLQNHNLERSFRRQGRENICLVVFTTWKGLILFLVASKVLKKAHRFFSFQKEGIFKKVLQALLFFKHEASPT